MKISPSLLHDRVDFPCERSGTRASKWPCRDDQRENNKLLLQRRDQKDEREAHCPLEVIKEVAAKGTPGGESPSAGRRKGGVWRSKKSGKEERGKGGSPS